MPIWLNLNKGLVQDRYPVAHFETETEKLTTGIEGPLIERVKKNNIFRQWSNFFP